MNKEDFLKKFKEEDKAEALNLYDKFNLALDKDIPVFSNEFYTPNIWNTVKENIKIKDFKIESYGVFNEAERKIISFNNIYDIEYPIKVLKVTTNSKFKSLKHKDFLGSLMNLGIKRSKMGDLILTEDVCYVVVFSDIAEFIQANLNKISNVGCEVSILDYENIEVNYEFKEEIINVQSLRLDSIVSKIMKKSRGIAEECINRGDVLINYSVCREKSKEIKENDRITVRKYGKCILGAIQGNSKSGKLKVIIKKYT
ncbi:YlmH/Sll1252 family protein [uncultured Clostridium sp.]|uniref:YlmH family RNA-binding protein n=1 Tax=uncultured Clostridium sp. TaxID=59620 RepID=UPI002617D2C6|nr:YlmH/Sll1252 family protein [uncultured Clostridium sp.]